MITVIADSHIPFLNEFTDVEKQRPFKLVTHPGHRLADQKADLSTADALLVRTVTSVDADLIANTPIQFIASATSGIDHVKLSELGSVTFTHAPGCNAQAVLEYVMACFQHCQSPKNHGRIGIIGHGHVGCLVEQAFKALGYETICHDPPKAMANKDFISSPLSHFQQLDALCIHPSLTPSSHRLVNDALLSQQMDGTLVINASRGEVACEEALKTHANRLKLCLDVWQNEPVPDQQLIEIATIATPHIAGYSAQAKWRATKTVMKALYAHFNIPFPEIVRPPTCFTETTTPTLSSISMALKEGAASSKTSKLFQELRQKMAMRKSWSLLSLSNEHCLTNYHD